MTVEPPNPSGELDLTYPCEWRYRVIGADPTALRAAIEAIAGDADHAIHEGNASRTGRYVSLELVMTVRDEAHRHGVFAMLAAHDDVKFVL